jgi:HPt (histidine-containing phosphotransfer) domain-containing protein
MSILKPGAAVEIPAGATAEASMPQMMQDLQQMYQQRRRIQAQQLQSALPPTN